MSPVTDRVRGVLQPVAASGKLLHARVAPSEPWREVVQHFWSVRWDLRGAKPFVPETLPHPNVHLVFEAEGARIVGVQTGRFTTRLEGKGWVFGVKFRPGAFRPYFGRSVASLRDRSVPIDEVFGTKGAALARKVSDLCGDAEKAAAIERFLNERKTPSDPNVERVSNIVDEIAENREIVSVEQVVERWALWQAYAAAAVQFLRGRGAEVGNQPLSPARSGRAAARGRPYQLHRTRHGAGVLRPGTLHPRLSQVGRLYTGCLYAAPPRGFMKISTVPRRDISSHRHCPFAITARHQVPQNVRSTRSPGAGGCSNSMQPG